MGSVHALQYRNRRLTDGMIRREYYQAYTEKGDCIDKIVNRLRVCGLYKELDQNVKKRFI